MIATRMDDVDDLNRRARQRLAAAGRLTGEPLQVDDRDYQVGDEVICLRNDRRIGVVNGTCGTVTAMDEAQGSLRIRAARHDFDLPADYLAAGHLTYGYAVTGHKAQGSTCERSFVLGSDELYREWAYTALSHRQDTRLYLNRAPEHGPEQHPTTLAHEASEPIADLARRLHRTRTQHLATDHPSDDVGHLPPGGQAKGMRDSESPGLLRHGRARAAREVRLSAAAAEHRLSPIEEPTRPGDVTLDRRAPTSAEHEQGHHGRSGRQCRLATVDLDPAECRTEEDFDVGIA